MYADLNALKAAVAQGERIKFLHFWGHTPRKDGQLGPTCLSQWWPSPFEVAGERFATAEHYMMAAKARLFGDDEMRARILATMSPGKAKALGRKVRGFDGERWERERERIVTDASLAKFRADPSLRDYLRATGDRVLVEASPRDRIWGIGLAASDPRAGDPRQWQGLNLLGFALMRARATL
jgi:ribA/ribD-fused uncharacterized protein